MAGKRVGILEILDPNLLRGSVIFGAWIILVASLGYHLRQTRDSIQNRK